MSILKETAQVRTNLENTHDFNIAANRIHDKQISMNQWRNSNLLNHGITTDGTNVIGATYTCASSLTN